MARKYKKRTLLIKSSIGGKNVGDLVKVDVDHEGTPIERYWRDRVKDSEIDGCVQFVEEVVNLSKKDKKEIK